MIYFIPNDVNIDINGVKKETNDVVEVERMDVKVREETKKVHKKSKKRCNLVDCRKKLNLTNFKCACGYTFCMKHKLPENHKCTQNLVERSKKKYEESVSLGGGEIPKVDKI